MHKQSKEHKFDNFCNYTLDLLGIDKDLEGVAVIDS